ncbi:2-hydroxyacyl-CoA dehydratase subunit D [Desulfatiglans anilini]|uniref:2-hydroxyacyl-CoA dehydratase subunit D n=1 Tax=Desulfatiglans anilini TaxID=90728 RepID=UPI000419F1D6|nr:2-hydroxyacyl-CoA dehydratase family protein [Desulfatiglans anilini]
MTLLPAIRYRFMKDIGAPAAMRFAKMGKKRPARPPDPLFAPPLAATRRLKELISRHYFLSRYTRGAMPVAWVTSGAPVEILRPFGYYTLYPENHSALCGAQKVGGRMCAHAEEHGYSPDLCSYARIDLGHALTGNTPVGRLPRPDLLFASNNICQTVLYWYKILAARYGIPLILFDTPYRFADAEGGPDLEYMVGQMEAIIQQLEGISGRRFDREAFSRTIDLAKETSLLWGRVLATMKARPAPMTIFDAFAHMLPIVSLRGLESARGYYRLLLEELEERAERGVGAIREERKRLMWDNIAIWPRMREHANLFASHGMAFVTATYTNAWAETTPLLDPGRPLESLAKAYSCVILNHHLEHRLKLMERLIREYRVDGLVIHSARSCKPYSVGQYDIKRLLLERLSIPSVVIEADIADERAYAEEQTRTRLEAFFEALEEE